LQREPRRHSSASDSIDHREPRRAYPLTYEGRLVSRLFADGDEVLLVDAKKRRYLV